MPALAQRNSQLHYTSVWQFLQARLFLCPKFVQLHTQKGNGTNEL